MDLVGLGLRTLRSPVAACGDGVGPLKERLQSSTCSNSRILEAWRLGGLDSWTHCNHRMLEYSNIRGLEAWILGLDGRDLWGFDGRDWWGSVG